MFLTLASKNDHGIEKEKKRKREREKEKERERAKNELITLRQKQRKG